MTGKVAYVWLVCQYCFLPPHLPRKAIEVRARCEERGALSAHPIIQRSAMAKENEPIASISKIWFAV